MADSNITKRALANALKEQLMIEPFAKISIAEICQRCDMNRKSFYYHFRDKYDLMNWIYDTEFIAVAKEKIYDDSWEFMRDMSIYFYENRAFYRRALVVKGQNSFTEHFREFLEPVLSQRLRESFHDDRTHSFQVTFFTDAIISALQRWILDKEAMPPEEFVGQLKLCLAGIAE